MSEKTYIGTCHCGHVRFEADLDITTGTGKCNCTICTKLRLWSMIVKPAAFRLIAGQNVLTDYRFNTTSVHHPFCRYCGVHAFSYGNIEEIGGEFYSVNLACLDDANFTELADAPVRYANGRDNDWVNRPAEVRHL